MRRPAVTALLLVCALACTWVLPGCSARWPWRQPSAPDPRQGAAAPALEPALQARLDALYTQGAEALGRNDVDGALAAWRACVVAAPADLPLARTLRGHLTLLQREAARRFARQAVAGERQLAAAGATGRDAVADRRHVAVFPFHAALPAPGGAAADEAAQGGFQRAVLAMVMVDLSRVPALTVLEREKVQALLDELRLADSGLVDPGNAARPGRLLGAGSVVAGTVLNEPGPAGPGSGRYRIHAAVSDVAAGRVLATPEAEGLQADFHRLEKQIVHGILDALGIRDIPPAVDVVHTRNWAAYARFARGLALLEQDRFDEARAAFRAALAFDPGFALAEAALLDTPEQAATLEQLRARAGPRH